MLRTYNVTGCFSRQCANATVEISSVSINLAGCNSREEALGLFSVQAMRQFPPSEGWLHFPPIIHEYSMEHLQMMLERARPESEIPESERTPLVK